MDAGKMIQERYELVEPLGKGGMADVWRAQDHHLRRPVAIKFLAVQLANDPEFLVRFFSEAQAVARISHPGVVKVLDFGEFEERPYLVMEVVEGGPLTELTGTPMEPDRALAIVLGAAAAAGAAHKLGIVHRDIKPGNILLDIDGTAKLADFGIASSGRSERLTATGAAIGSPHYISPEQASGGEATPASDVYALGIVLYELLCGRRPFEGDNVTAIAIAQVEQPPAPPTTHVPELGAAIDALVLGCLAKDPAERFPDGTELAAALERFDATDVEPDEDVAVLPPAWWRNRKVLAGAAVVALLIAIPVVGGFASSDDSTATAEDTEDSLPNVGGLGMKKSPSPTTETDGSGATVPTPSPTAGDKEENDGGSGSRGDEPDPDRAGADEPDPEPTPDPEETATEPTPEPTPDGGSPAPEP